MNAESLAKMILIVESSDDTLKEMARALLAAIEDLEKIERLSPPMGERAREALKKIRGEENDDGLEGNRS